jgi:hypothetical protein
LKENNTLKKIALTALLAIMMLPVASIAQVVIRVGPPQHVVEVPGPPTHEGYVWTAGYERYDSDHYVWVPGEYQQPPHPDAVWLPHHWEQKDGNWILVDGRWK